MKRLFNKELDQKVKYLLKQKSILQEQKDTPQSAQKIEEKGAKKASAPSA